MFTLIAIYYLLKEATKTNQVIIDSFIFEIIKTKGFSILDLLSKTKTGNFLFQIFTLEFFFKTQG